jgi:hypothetical protein
MSIDVKTIKSRVNRNLLLFSLKEAGECMGISADNVLYLIKKDKLGAVLVHCPLSRQGFVYRVRETDIKKYIKKYSRKVMLNVIKTEFKQDMRWYYDRGIPVNKINWKNNA